MIARQPAQERRRAHAGHLGSQQQHDRLLEGRGRPPGLSRVLRRSGRAPRPPKRKKAGKRKPAGSRWLNYLLALGCLASLLPLWFEYRGHKNEPFVQPHKDDPWVRAQQRRARRRAAAL